MKNPTFRKQFDKIVTAYLRNELEPLDPCACFIGNMLNNKKDWRFARASKTFANGATGDITVDTDPVNKALSLTCVDRNANGFYTLQELYELERVFLWGDPMNITWSLGNPAAAGMLFHRKQEERRYEESLFAAMERTLLCLKELHESKGEVVEDYSFARREVKEEVTV